MSPETNAFIASISGWVIAFLIAACAFFLKQVADDIKETRKAVAKHDIILASHQIMYQLWLEDLSQESKHPQRRDSDKIRSMIAEIVTSHAEKET